MGMGLRFRLFLIKTKTILLHELRANTTPVRASLSLALGILIGFSPFYGFHTPLVLCLAFLLRLNRVLALLATSTTILPFVPFWLAAGIFTGRQVMSLETASRLIDHFRHFLPTQTFDIVIDKLFHVTKHLLTPALFDKVTHGSEHHLLSAFVQWFVGCCVLATISALVTFAVSYFILRRVAARRLKRAAARAGQAIEGKSGVDGNAVD